MFSHCLIVLSFEQYLKGLFLVLCSSSSQAFDKNIPLLILLDIELRCPAVLKQIHKCLIVELKIGDGHLDLMLISGVYFLVERGDDPWDDTSVFVVRLCPSHCECLACSGLSITKHASGISIECAGEYLLSCKVENDLLRSI